MNFDIGYKIKLNSTVIYGVSLREVYQVCFISLYVVKVCLKAKTLIKLEPIPASEATSIISAPPSGWKGC